MEGYIHYVMVRDSKVVSEWHDSRVYSNREQAFECAQAALRALETTLPSDYTVFYRLTVKNQKH